MAASAISLERGAAADKGGPSGPAAACSGGVTSTTRVPPCPWRKASCLPSAATRPRRSSGAAGTT
eukprot:12203279-Alexandrium_andersonii.AAC.1